MTSSQQLSVSVLIATYNAEGFVERAVLSAANQSYRAQEILIIDDASTDGTVRLVETLRKRDERIRIVSLEQNGGPAVARNVGIDAAVCQWIAVLDADDCLRTNYLQTLVSAITDDTDVILSNFEYYSVQLQKTFPSGVALTPSHRSISIYDYVEHARPNLEEADWGLLKPFYNRKFLKTKNVRYPAEVRHGEDFLFIMNALLSGARVKLSTSPLYLYTDSYSGFSRTKVDYKLMSHHADRLCEDQAVRGNAKLKRLLRLRSKDIRAHESIRELTTLRKRRDFRKLALAVLTDRFMFYAVCRLIARKLVGKAELGRGRGR